MLELLIDADVYAPARLGRRSLLIGGGRILWIGEGEPTLDSGLDVVLHDLAGRRLIPGLIDPHVHITGGGGEAGPASKVPALPIESYTTAGVTTVVGLLGTDDTTRSVGELVTAARGLEHEGLSAWCWTGGYHLPPTTLTGSVRGDIVHVDRILGVGEVAVSDHRSSQPTPDDLRRVAADAHVAGLMSGKAGVLHLHLGDGERGLAPVRQALEGSELPARVFHPTHVNRRKALFDEALEMAALGSTIDVSAFPDTDSEREWSAVEAWLRFRDAGLPSERLTMSSDAGGMLPEFDTQGQVSGYGVGTPRTLIETVRALVDAGNDLSEVLPAFTTNSARLLRLGGKGCIERGSDADLVVLNGEGAVRDVYVRGVRQVESGRAIVRGTFSGPGSQGSEGESS
jgi:beta-aspartyl-dipeptidase (metallo-type)